MLLLLLLALSLLTLLLLALTTLVLPEARTAHHPAPLLPLALMSLSLALVSLTLTLVLVTIPRSPWSLAPLLLFLPGLKHHRHALPGHLHAALTALRGRQRGGDGFTRRFDGFEIDKGACFASDEFDRCDFAEAGGGGTEGGFVDGFSTGRAACDPVGELRISADPITMHSNNYALSKRKVVPSDLVTIVANMLSP